MENNMSKTYLKTYFYVDHEIQFLTTNLEESYNHIDKFIIVNLTEHTLADPESFLVGNI